MTFKLPPELKKKRERKAGDFAEWYSAGGSPHDEKYREIYNVSMDLYNHGAQDTWDMVKPVLARIKDFSEEDYASNKARELIKQMESE